MTSPLRRSRVVLVSPAGLADSLARVFEAPALRGANLTVAGTLEYAHFRARLHTADVLLVDESALGDDPAALAWLAGRRHVPVILLTGPSAECLPQALAAGIHLWLPRNFATERPELLAEALRHALRAGLPNRLPEPDDLDGHARLERLSDLLWNARPVDGRTGWLSQRYVLERLHEEVVRSGRHGTPLTIVLAEMTVGSAERTAARERTVWTWAAERVLRSKRRSDVAGQYGTRGFLLLLPHTPERGAEEYCRRLRRDFEQAPGRLHASFGVAAYSSDCPTPKGLLCRAEQRLAPHPPDGDLPAS